MTIEEPGLYATPQAPPANPVPRNAPEPGTIRKGYRFKGGDPSKPESWEPVT